jgi:hypothetical protein
MSACYFPPEAHGGAILSAGAKWPSFQSTRAQMPWESYAGFTAVERAPVAASETVRNRVERRAAEYTSGGRVGRSSANSGRSSHSSEPPKRTVTCGMSAERWMPIQNSAPHVDFQRIRSSSTEAPHYLETS